MELVAKLRNRILRLRLLRRDAAVVFVQQRPRLFFDGDNLRQHLFSVGGREGKRVFRACLLHRQGRGVRRQPCRDRAVFRRNGVGGGFAVEIVFQDGARYGGYGGAGAASFNHHGHGDLRLVIGRVADEHTVVFRVVAELNRTGLRADAYREILEDLGG